MLSHAERGAPFATAVHDPLDDEGLEYGLGEMASPISSSDSFMYQEPWYVWDFQTMLVRYSVCYNATLHSQVPKVPAFCPYVLLGRSSLLCEEL